jgi:hypothetical protein
MGGKPRRDEMPNERLQPTLRHTTTAFEATRPPEQILKPIRAALRLFGKAIVGHLNAKF